MFFFREPARISCEFILLRQAKCPIIEANDRVANLPSLIHRTKN